MVATKKYKNQKKVIFEMKKISILLIAIILSSTMVYAGDVFVFQFEIDKEDNVVVKNFLVSEGTLRYVQKTPYVMSLYSNEKILSQHYFNVDFGIEVFGEEDFLNESDKNVEIEINPLDPSEKNIFKSQEEELESTFIQIYLPSRKEMTSLSIDKNNVPIYTLDVDDYLCNNNDVCGGYESIQNCPNDCSVETTQTEGSNIKTFLIVFILILIVFILIILALKKGRSIGRNKN